MRLTCPNCGAQYEVPDNVIPAEGRDVQCSDCGTTWFQDKPGTETRADADTPPTYDAPDPDSEPQEDFTAETQESVEQPSDLEPDEDDIDYEEEDAPEPQVDDPRPKRKLDASVTAVLREEATREQALRAAEASGLETQPDLGLEQPSRQDTVQRAQQTRERMARLRGEDPDAPPQNATQGSRRGVLPDIEEINSSLNGNPNAAMSAGTDAAAYPAQRNRSGFVRGFTVTILLTVGAALIYQNAGALSAAVPEAAPALDAYVTWVNESRVWLHSQVERLAQPQS